MKKFVAICNPAAGGGKGRKMLPGILGRLKDGGVECEVHTTKGPGDATQIANDLYHRGDRNFLVMGGDGTTFEVINGLFPLASENHKDRPILGFLPVGTGNSFLRDFTKNGLEHSIQTILNDTQRSCDVIRVQHDRGDLFFINIFSFGFVADVGATRNKHFHSLGEFGYVLGVFKELAGLHSTVFPMSIDHNQEVKDPVTFISINNSKFTGGKMMMAPNANTSDGHVDFIQVNPMGRMELLKAFPRIFKGTHIHLPKVSSRPVQTIDFNLDREIDVMVDGEMVRLRPQHLEVLPQAFDVRV